MTTPVTWQLVATIVAALMTLAASWLNLRASRRARRLESAERRRAETQAQRRASMEHDLLDRPVSAWVAEGEAAAEREENRDSSTARQSQPPAWVFEVPNQERCECVYTLTGGIARTCSACRYRRRPPEPTLPNPGRLERC